MAAVPQQFSDHYHRLLEQANAMTLKETATIPEKVLQRMWQRAVFPEPLQSLEGHTLQILAPGWLNTSGGPDFSNAQITFNGETFTGDVEIHRNMRDWYDHRHHEDPAYNDVTLHVVSTPPDEKTPRATTAAGRTIATLVWPGEEALYDTDTQHAVPAHCGACASEIVNAHPDVFRKFLALAGEWRMLEKQRRLRARMDTVGPDQAIYEMFMVACGYSNYKEQMLRVARALPYERARQLAQQTPQLLEVALLRIAGLLPDPWPHAEEPPPHYVQAMTALREHLPGLGTLELDWRKTSSRPANNPERRLAGAARFLTRTADYGLHQKLEMAWRAPMTPLERRRAIEALFGGAMGFWAHQCTWNGAPLARPSAPLGTGRIRTIIGNALVPAALAWARLQKSARLEDHLHEFFAALPGEAENSVHRTMQQWLFPEGKPFRIGFREQQGLMQMHQDWCAHNPSCRNCTVLVFLRSLETGDL